MIKSSKSKKEISATTKTNDMNKEFENLSESELIKKIEDEELLLKDCPNQTKAMCMTAVKKNGYDIQYVRNQEDDVCLEAIKEYPFSIQFVIFPNEEMKLEAVKRDYRALRFIENPTYEMCFMTVKQRGDALEYIPKRYQTDELCVEACKNKFSGIKYVKRQNKELCKLALNQDPENLLYCRCEIDEPNLKFYIFGSADYKKFLCEKVNDKWMFSKAYNYRFTGDEMIKHIMDYHDNIEDLMEYDREMINIIKELDCV